MTAWRELRDFAGDATLVAAKDLRIEWRARTTLGQVVPFALLVLVLFGFALNANRPTLQVATPGLLWMTALFTTVVAVQRSVAVESDDGARRMLLLSGMAPAAAFAGKAAAVAAQLLAVELLLVPGVCCCTELRSTRWPWWPQLAWRPRSGWRPPVACSVLWLRECEPIRRSCRSCCFPCRRQC